MNRFAPLLCLLCGCLVNPTPGPQPTPGPASDAATVSHDATVAYSQLVADVMRDAASKLKAGELKTDREAIDFIKAQTEAARKAAFAPVGKLIQEQVGGDKWDAAKMAALCEGIEAGHRKVR